MSDCPVCRHQSANVTGLDDVDGWTVACPACGQFKCTMESVKDFDQRANVIPKCRAHLSGYLRELTERRRLDRAHVPLLVTSRKNVSDSPAAIGVDDALATYPLPVQGRLDVLLQNLVLMTNEPGTTLKLQSGYNALGYASSEQTLGFLLNQLRDDGLVRIPHVQTMHSPEATVTPKGWNRYAELERGRIASEPLQGFIAMWMDRDRRNEWEPGLREGVRRAGYEPLVIDQIEFVGSISDRVIAEIRKSCFVVADFTGHRPNVYFEAGFAEGLGIPVVFTCQTEQIKKLHFDKRQENTIPWTDCDELSERLHRRIEAVIGRPVCR